MPLKERMSFSEEPLYLVDGSSFLYRAFYAFPDLKRSDGFPTNAIFILLRILLKLLREEDPRYVGFFLDGKKPSFRREIMEEYKANRPKMPEPLAMQIPELVRAVGLLGMTLEVTEGVEADDCIASLAHRFKSARPVVIVGSDKDLYQCLDENVLLWDPGQRTEKVLTLEEFTNQQGLSPSQWPDYLALVGDKSDNIPGIPGIGPKSAQSLLQRHGSIEGIVAKFDHLTTKEQEKLHSRLDDLLLYRKLTTLRLDSCPDAVLKGFSCDPVDESGLVRFLQEFEFRSLARELRLRPEKGKPQPLQPRRKPTPVEPTPLSPPLELASQEAIGLVAKPGEYRLGLGEGEHVWQHGNEQLVRELEKILVYTPSLKERLSEDAAWGEHPVEQWFDLSLAAYLLDPEERDYSWDSLRERFGSDVEVHPDNQGLFALKQGQMLRVRLEQAGLLELFYTLELPLVPVLVRMEQRGIRIDLDAFSSFLEEVQARLEELSTEVCSLAGQEFNIRSSQQLGEVLFQHLELKSRKKTPGGAFSTSNQVLETIQTQHPIVPLILEYRVLEKLRSTYLSPLPSLVDANSRIHTTFNNLATATGRLSSSRPNLQNIPIRGIFGPRMRSCFVAGPGNVLVAGDYSQIELRILAHMSQDGHLLEAFERDEDIHSRTAALLFDKDAADVTGDERRKAKTINFGLLYGMGPQKLGRELGIPLREAKEFIEKYFHRLPRVRQFYEEVERLAREQGYVTTLFGRRRLLPDINSRNPHLVQQARRMAINTVIQGSAADIIKMSMLQVDNDPHLAGMDAELLLQVHDELLLEVPKGNGQEAGARLAEIMSSVYSLSVPLVVEWGAGKDWNEAH